MSLALMSMLMLAGLTGCKQAEKAVDDVTESAKKTVDTAKSKAVEMLGGTEKNETEVQTAQKNEGNDDGEGEKKE